MNRPTDAARLFTDDRGIPPPLRLDERRSGCLTDQGEQTLIDLIAALISAGTSFFEDIFAQVRALVGDYRYEQLISDLLTENDGLRWESFSDPAGDFSYRIINR